jgi:DNA phosphorothioation-associated putative methyltransferase
VHSFIADLSPWVGVQTPLESRADSRRLNRRWVAKTQIFRRNKMEQQLTSENATSVQRHLTAMHRTDLSRPIRLALESGLVDANVTVFDYGCGRGEDLRRLRSMGIPCSGWDPTFSPGAELAPAEVVNLGYVVNVIESVEERAAALRAAWQLSRKLLIVSARLTNEMSAAAWSRCNDGFLTKRATFQKFYEQQELRSFIESVLAYPSIPAAPGIFYVFRDKEAEQAHLASRFQRRITVPRIGKGQLLFESHEQLLQPLMQFITARGRLPQLEELGEAGQLIVSVLGSIRRAFQIVQEATGSKQWDRIAAERKQDLLVYLALARFGGRPALAEFPRQIGLDVRALYGSYRDACLEADALLFAAGRQDEVSKACGDSPIGKCTPEALYLHIDALPSAAPLIRVYEGCARAYVGSVEGGNIVKMHRRKPQVSYLAYPEFESEAHPALRESLKVRFRGLEIEYRDYRQSPNPFVLHRKELFLLNDHPLRTKFVRLTRQEEKQGLLCLSHDSIGTREGWKAVLRERGLVTRGHRLLRACRQASGNRA